MKNIDIHYWIKEKGGMTPFSEMEQYAQIRL